MNEVRHSEAAFEAVTDAHLLDHGYTPVAREDFDHERAIFPEVTLDFIRQTSRELAIRQTPSGESGVHGQIWQTLSAGSAPKEGEP